MEKQTRVFFKSYSILHLLVALNLLGVIVFCSACAAKPIHVTHLALEEGVEFETALFSSDDAVVEGGVFFAHLRFKDNPKIVEGEFQNKQILFYRESKSTVDNLDHGVTNYPFLYSALVGVEYGAVSDQKNSKISLQISWTTSEGLRRSQTIAIKVKAGTYPSESLTVAPRTVTPNRKDKIQIAKDRVILGKIYSNILDEKLWDGPVEVPVNLGITSVYGSSRVYNGKKTNVHFGTDYRAPVGTPIKTPLTGKVVLARNLFYTGNTVILDHGHQFFTIYGHLSKLKVKEGHLLQKGAIMGLSGATGRVSGPHLHLGVSLHGVKVDPLVLFSVIDAANGSKNSATDFSKNIVEKQAVSGASQ